jgi:hypothetical protein
MEFQAKGFFSITPTEISSFSTMETERSGCFQGRNYGRFNIQHRPQPPLLFPLKLLFTVAVLPSCAKGPEI